MEGMVVNGLRRIVVLFVVIFVPVRGTGSISNSSSVLPTLRKVLVMVNLATDLNKVRIILIVLSRGWRVV